MADFTVSGFDLFLSIANRVRRDAENRANFENSRVMGTMALDGVNGTALSDIVFTTGTITGVVGSGSGATTANGTWTRIGTHNGKDAFIRINAVGAVLFLYYPADNNDKWYVGGISDFPNEGASGLHQLITSSSSPAGSYSNIAPATGTYVVTAAGSFSSLKEVTAVTRLRPDGTYQPLDFTRADIGIERDRYEYELSDDLYPTNRYPSDADLLAGTANSSIVQINDKLFIHPRDVAATDTIDIQVFGVGYLSDYDATTLTATEPTDWFTNLGRNYLMWSIACEINYLWKTWVPRTEGNLSPPEQARAQAWKDLITMDSYRVDANVTRSR